MALYKKGQYWYGSSMEDVVQEMQRFSSDCYTAQKFAQSICSCGERVFTLESDEDEGAARRTCVACGNTHLMGDSAEYADTADFDNHVCICDGNEFELVSGVALYSESNDVRWYYIGCRCTACNLVGVFADYSCEAGDADVFLANV